MAKKTEHKGNDDKMIKKLVFKNTSKLRPLLIIDLFGVIISGSYRDTCRWIASKYKLDFDKVYQVVYHKYFSAATLGKLTESQSFSLAAKELGLKERGYELRKIHLSFQKLNKPVLDLFKNLEKGSVKMVLFSKNTPGQFNEILRMYNLGQYFPFIINSYNLGLEKKSRQAMEYLLQRFKSLPSETLFIDDQEFNFENAKKIGITTILYQSPSILQKNLQNWLRKFNV